MSKLPLDYRVLLTQDAKFLLQRDVRSFDQITQGEQDERARRYFELLEPVGIAPLSKSASVQNEPRDEAGRWARAGGAATAKAPRIHPNAVLPRSGFDGVRGHSRWSSSDPTLRSLTDGRPVVFKNGFPDFSPFVARIGGLKARVSIQLAGDRDTDFRRADRALAQKLGWMNRNGRPDAARAKAHRRTARLTWHHKESPCGQMELVPTAIHAACHHAGGFSCCPTP